MRLEISYTGGTTHEVDLPGKLCVVGRDPGCDIVLNDSKCSRRHAVIEDGPDGLVIRDSGSANGIYVNGKKVEQAPLRPGDSVKLGEVKLRLLAEIGETVVVAPLDLDAVGGGPGELGDSGSGPLPAPERVHPPASAPPPAPKSMPRPRSDHRPPRERPSPRAASGPARPATVSLLAGLWAFFVPVAMVAVLVTAARLQAGWLGWLGAAALAAVCAGLGTSMALGLRALASWARHLQIATAAVGLLVCPFTLAAATVLLYMTRPEVRAAFESASGSPPGSDSGEPTFAISLVGMLLLGLALTAIALLLL